MQRKIGSVTFAAMLFTAAAIATPAMAQSAPKPAPESTPAEPQAPHAKPIGSPAEWFPATAYPPEARAAGQQGRTVFLVKLDARGRILECDVVQSSGSPLLDNTTCDLVVSNGRFAPARDAQGNAVPGIWQSAMRWQLTATEPSVDSDSD